MRRVAGAALAIVALLALGPPVPAGAQESQPDGDWAGSTLVPANRPCDNDDICGEFRRVRHPLLGLPQITVAFTLESVATSLGCALPANPPPSGPFRSPHTFNVPLTFECNGTYRSIADATADRGESRGQRLDRTFTVANPAPEVAPPTTSVDATRAVTIRWSALAAAPKDFRGYTVLRTAAGRTDVIATLSPLDTSWIDVNPPAEGGEMTYAVQTRRAGANPTDPTSEVSSSGASAEPIEVAPAAVDPDDPTDPSLPGDPTDPSTPGPTDPGGPSNPSNPGGGSGNGGGGSLPTTSLRVPRVGTPSRNFFPPLLSPPVDTGFDEDLPFEEPGEEAAVLPDDLASPLPEQAGRGLVIPAAIGLVLAVWAFHLRFLARMARPQYVEAGDDPPELIHYE